MNKTCCALIAVLILATFRDLPAQDNIRETFVKGFLNPPDSVRPKVYWWCLNGNIDTVTARQEFLDMRNAGIRGFDMFEIGVPKEDTMIPGGPAFLSDESLKVIKFVVSEAGRLGLQVGLNLASSWNAGGSWITPQNAGKSLYFSKTSMRGNSRIQKIDIPFPRVEAKGNVGESLIKYRADGRPVYYEDVVLLAIPAGFAENKADTARIINISHYFDPGRDILTWKAPPGNWDIYRYVCSNSGQQLVMPSPHSAGLTVDHFDSVAVRTHFMYIIDRLKPVLGDFRNTALKSLYLASYEARGFVWSPTLPSEFRKINGYDIYKLIPSLFDKELFSKETNDRVQSDFRKTLSEMMISNLYLTARRICHSYGLKINCEAGGPGYPLYNGPAEPLRALGVLDIPRGEFWVKHSRYYLDSDSHDSIDILRVVKEVSAASHIYQRGVAEEESFTSFQHWQEGPCDLKPVGDRAFCEGMNRVVFHGFSHNPQGTGFPGYVYHAGTHFNDKRVWWPMAGPFVDYISRISYIAREADFMADVLYYYGDKIPNSVTPKNTTFTAGPGYDYEVINTDVLLNRVTVKERKLVLSGKAEFSLLVLKNEEEINPLVLTRLKELAGQGAIIIGAKPLRAAPAGNMPDNESRYEAMIDDLWSDAHGDARTAVRSEGRIFSGVEPQQILEELGIPPDIACMDTKSVLPDYIHYRKGNIDFYFIRNTTSHWITGKYGFRLKAGIPEIWDPVTGSTAPVRIFDQGEKYIKIPITMAPYGSYFAVFSDGVPLSHYTDVSDENNMTPYLEYNKRGILFLKEGTIRLEKESGPSVAVLSGRSQTIDGEWKLLFTKGWGAPDSTVLHGLSSWTENPDPGIRYYSGTATYVKSFMFAQNMKASDTDRVLIDLGRVSKIARVSLNGHDLGILWTQPYRADITDYVKSGENILIIIVANVWSNRLTGDAITGEKFTNTNITGNGEGLVPWAKVPLVESGLLGPVTIQTVTLTK